MVIVPTIEMEKNMEHGLTRKKDKQLLKFLIKRTSKKHIETILRKFIHQKPRLSAAPVRHFRLSNNLQPGQEWKSRKDFKLRRKSKHQFGLVFYENND